MAHKMWCTVINSMFPGRRPPRQQEVAIEGIAGHEKDVLHRRALRAGQQAQPCLTSLRACHPELGPRTAGRITNPARETAGATKPRVPQRQRNGAKVHNQRYQRCNVAARGRTWQPAASSKNLHVPASAVLSWQLDRHVMTAPGTSGCAATSGASGGCRMRASRIPTSSSAMRPESPTPTAGC